MHYFNFYETVTKKGEIEFSEGCNFFLEEQRRTR